MLCRGLQKEDQVMETKRPFVCIHCLEIVKSTIRWNLLNMDLMQAAIEPEPGNG